MFKNGGPIKGGIMSGMKDNTGTGLVGDKRYPTTDGRSHHFAVAPFIMPALAAAGRFALRPIGKFVARQSKGGKLLGLKPVEKFQVNPFIKNDPLYSSIATGTSMFGKGIRKGAGLAKSAVKYGTTTPSGLLLTGSTVGPYAYGKIKEGFKKDAPDKIETEGGPPGGGNPDMFLEPGKKSKEELDKITKDRIEANRERYYKLMGIDKMNKQAAYNTLIDASNQIREGGNIKDQLKSGDLVSGVINALSKNLDKSVDLKKQIDAAILKGEIEKDIKASDPQAAKRAEYIDKQIALADRKLEGGDLSDVAAMYSKDGRSLKGQNLFAEADRKGIKVDGILDTADVDKFMNDNPTLTEASFIEEIQKKRIENNQPPLPEGNYVVGGRIVHINETGAVDKFVF